MALLARSSNMLLRTARKEVWRRVCTTFSAAAATRCGRRSYATQQHNVPLTVETKSYEHLRRGDFGKVTPEDISRFEAILPGRVMLDEDSVAPYNQDWMNKYRGSSRVVLRPKTTEEVQAIVQHCNERRLAIVPQGGNTGLVGGGVPVFDEIVLSTSLMNEIKSLDPVSGILVCQAGCVLASVEEYLSENGFTMPLDLGAKGSCQIGGNVSTNAGGIRLLRYGSLHASVLSLTAVLGNGELLTQAPLRKDNTGYDLKQLMIGSEGTLGIVTEVAIAVPQKPAAVNVAFLGCNTYEDVMKTFVEAKKNLGEILSAFEFLDHGSMKLCEDYLGAKNPLGTPYEFYVLLETHGSSQSHDEEKIESMLTSSMEATCVVDGVLAQDTTQAAALWAIREGITEALKKEGTVYKYDVSLPLPVLYELVTQMQARVEDRAISCVGYGHVGDGNLHLNITSKEPDNELLAQIEPFVYEFTESHNGSISAEHGLGLMKPQHIYYSKPREAVDIMRNIKGICDPNGIMNPYKTIPAQ